MRWNQLRRHVLSGANDDVEVESSDNEGYPSQEHQHYLFMVSSIVSS